MSTVPVMTDPVTLTADDAAGVISHLEEVVLDALCAEEDGSAGVTVSRVTVRTTAFLLGWWMDAPLGAAAFGVWAWLLQAGSAETFVAEVIPGGAL